VLLLINYFLSSLSGFLSTTAFSSLLTLSIAALLLSILVERMTKNSLAAMLTAAVLLAVLMFTYTLFQDKFAGLVPAFMENLSLFARFEDMTGGVLDLRTLVLFLSVAGVFLYMTVQSLEKRRWSET
jgi:ABC-2 type transport system permease protein